MKWMRWAMFAAGMSFVVMLFVVEVEV